MKKLLGNALSKAGDMLDKTKSRISTTFDEKNPQEIFEDMKIGAERGAAALSEGYKNSGAQGAMERAGDKLDEISGKKILEEMREAFKIQAIYNDTLATKLQEALNRIADLEAKASKP